MSGGTRLLRASALFALSLAPCLAAAAAAASGDGASHARDFDFAFGAWKTHIQRRLHPLGGSSEWVEYDGTHVIDKVWNGVANLGVLEADGKAGHVEALSLRLYNPASHQWNVSYANPREGKLGGTVTGAFDGGHGAFYGTDTLDGRAILVRELYVPLGPDARRLEVAYSADGGKTWEPNWIMTDTRLAAPPQSPGRTNDETIGAHDGSHDFDFEIGRWKTSVRRLANPLTGSTNWVAYQGTTVVRPIWGGRANLVELEMDGPKGHFRGLNLRLYDPVSRQWSLTFANAAAGVLNTPAIGAFKEGRGEFYDQELLDGRAILVRFVISNITNDACHFEQAFSADGGKTWETNWIADDTRDGA
ncbi:MAG TPA: hypothetical protein VFL30_12350 [Rhodanobacteraceae bacterium]|nr:hypothetical protein [Rhodanobacteraceae bacterium]